MKQVFVDSGGFFALLVPQDHSHAAALDVFARAELEHWSLVTTNIVVIETYALLLARTRPGRPAAVGFLDAFDESGVRVERVRRIDEEGAETLVRTLRAPSRVAIRSTSDQVRPPQRGGSSL